MPSISLRIPAVPNGGILLKADTTLPNDYTNLCSYNGKFIKQVPNACTNPGTSVGNATHQHNSTGCHTHTTVGSLAHTHVFTSGNATNNASTGGGNSRFDITHTHTWTTTSATPTGSSTSSGVHTHNSQNNCPVHRTYRMIKKGTKVSIRASHLPKDSLIIWSKTLASIPSRFDQDTNIYTRLVKIANCPGTNAGTNNHTHDAVGHSHTVNSTNHTHTPSGTSSAVGPTNDATGSTCFTGPNTHTHTAGTLTTDNISHSGVTDSPTHTHDTLSIKPASIESALIKINRISLRQKVLPKGSAILWEDTLASIPNNFALADGSVGTTNYLDKYIAGIPDACTNPGSSIGSHTHQHNATNVAHSVTLTGTHTGSGTSSTATASGGRVDGSGFSQVHSHTGGSTNSASINTTTDNPTHQHASLDHKPASVEVAIIERI